MGKINILSENLINKISAGEVLERPASCVKELIENSIDAEANTITIELLNSGKDKIIITDNGNGIDYEDLNLILKKYTTSKIKDEEDLFNINSYGFRGEALSSIASVSKVTIKTKIKENNFAYELKSDFLKDIKISKTSFQDGTSIEINNIFHNTPARLKFLKTNQTELGHCINVINNFAISNPNISFKLTHNNKTILFYPKTTNHTDRLNLVFNNKHKWIYNKLEYAYLNAEIFILDPMFSKKKEYKIFVNQRYVFDKIISHAINSSLEKYTNNSFNTLVIFLNINPHFVDVNVAPSKTEIRFREPNIVHDFILNLIDNIFNKNTTNEKATTNSKNISNHNFSNNTFSNSTSYKNTDYNNAKIPVKESKYNFKNDIIINSNNYRKIIGQYKNQYIVLEENNKLVLIDQHAAHERINFEKILNKLKKDKEVQILLIPEILNLSYSDSLKLDKLIPDLNKIGFEIEKEDTNDDNFFNYIIRTIPRIFIDIDINQLLFEVIKDEINNTDSINKISTIAASLSCHSSVRGSTILDINELKKIINDLDACQYPYTCPHGRPSKLEFSYTEIQKMFKRI